MINFKIKTLAASICLIAGNVAYAGNIDLFTTDQAEIVSTIAGGSLNSDFSVTPNLTAAAAAMSTVDTAGTDIVGGERDLYVQAVENHGSASGESTMKVEGSTLTFNNDANIAGIGQVQWDGNDNNASFGTTSSLGGIDTNGLGGIDLTDGGNVNAFQLVTLFADAAWQFGLTIFEHDLTDGDMTDNAWVRIVFDVTEVGTDTITSFPSPHISPISFAGFALGTAPCGAPSAFIPSLPAGVASVECSAGALPGSFGANGIDLENVGAIVADFNTGDAKALAVDLTLAQVTTVPEPSSLALIGLGLLTAGFKSRRKKSA